MAHSVTLNEVESTLRQLLLDVAEFIERNPVQAESSHVPLPDVLAKAPLELRFTGGWVRDKLLGFPSHDIDVAINKMTGYQFGSRLKEYLDAPGNAEKYGLGGVKKKAGSLTKIDANPEKSKHLETVTTKILGLDIDLVNLRKETYTADSRNPQIEFGSPEEDALRRDATINAMFYNITTSQLEDLSGSGLHDLEAHIIRTPMEPYTTFEDDPLRVLRLIRFASRLGYEIDVKARDAMKSEKIREALRLKITRERVWIEVEKMLKGPDARTALQYIDDLDLYHTIFTDPVEEFVYQPELGEWGEVYEFLDDIMSSRGGIQLQVLLQNDDEKFMSWVLAAMVPWTDAPEPLSKRGKPPPSMVASVAIAGLKAPNKITDLLTACVRNLKEIRELKDKGEKSRDVLGMAIRRWGITWRQQVMFALLYEVFTSPDNKGIILDSFDTFLTTITSLSLLDAHTLKPLIDGTKLAKALSTPPGPWMKEALNVVMAWQLRNPSISDPAAAVEEVKISGIATKSMGKGEKHIAKKQKTGELTSALISHFLRLTLRPLFAQTPKNPEITVIGRRKIGEVGTRRGGEFVVNQEDTKPWKFKEKWALDLLRWICGALNAEILEREWGVLIPPVLMVLDDTDVNVRAMGAELIRLLLLATPPHILKRTGLAPLFEDSLYICTTYLPTLTSEEDSIRILNTAIPALLVLTDAAFPAPLSPEADPTAHTARMKSLDKILRTGILFPYNHATEYVHITEKVLHHLPSILGKMGIDSVKHLKDLIPLLSNILSDPLGVAYPPILLTAIRVLQSCVLNGWPRMGGWRGEILKGVVSCYMRIEGENDAGKQLYDVKRELKELVGMLKVAVKSDEEVDWDGDVALLLQADERLKGLFE